MQRNPIILAVLALSLNCRAPAPAQVTPDDGLGALLRSMVTDSLVGGGRRADQRYVAADAVSDSLLRGSGLAPTVLSDGEQLACPASTDANSKPVASEVGYIVRVDRTEQAPGVLHLKLTVSCTFIFRGDRRGFAQGSTWELRQLGEQWRVTSRFARWVT